jgi:hypothetical protein
MKRTPASNSFGIGIAVSTSQILAHHSMGIDDQTRVVTLKGTIARIEWGNPHRRKKTTPH